MKTKSPLSTFNKLSTSLCCFIGCSLSWSVLADPPEPELGKRWVVNSEFSDEFNGNALDRTKWQDFIPGWQGRPPAKFIPESISVQGGNLQIRSQPLSAPDGPYTIGGGAVRSTRGTAYHGYYEAKVKASRINMSTTFWLSSDGRDVTNPNNQQSNCNNDRWHNELDIVEAVGGVFNQPWAQGFRAAQQYNTHVWFTNCSGVTNSFKRGVNAAEGDGSAPVNNDLPNGEEVWENFNTYAAWWKNENEVSFYLNDSSSGNVQVSTDLYDQPYNHPMHMFMVNETYDFAIPYPTTAQLNDNAINTSYYDWVRSYQLIGVAEPAPAVESGLIINKGFENGDFNHWGGWGGNPREVTTANARSGSYSARVVGAGAIENRVALQTNTEYKITAYVDVIAGSIFMGAKAVDNSLDFGSTEQTVTSGQYAKISFSFNSGTKQNVKLFFYTPAGGEYYIDDVDFEQISPVPPPVNNTPPNIFADTVTFKTNAVQGDSISSTFVYRTNIDREAEVVLYDNNTVVTTDRISLKAGYGHADHILDISSVGNVAQPFVELNMLPVGQNTVLATSGKISLDAIVQNSGLLNAGFETGNFNQWLGWGGSPREVVQNNAHSGLYAAHVVGAGAVERVMSLQANTEYKLTAYAKVLSGNLLMGAKANNASGSPDYGATAQGNTSGQYEKVSFKFNTGSQTNIKLYFYAQNGTEFYIDDIVISEVLLTNADFETGDFSQWIGWGGSPREVVQNNAHSGAYAAHVVGAGAVERALTLEANTNYTLTAYAKVLSGNLLMGAKTNNASGTPGFGAIAQGNTSGQYNQVTFSFNTGAQTNIKLYFYAQNGSEFYIDDIELE